ncbi:hypothetical protein J6590_074029 [Homalodisca vitripennis]|nr:hypothetical protein J6590_074029 [Homalodisca vitripennis]
MSVRCAGNLFPQSFPKCAPRLVLGAPPLSTKESKRHHTTIPVCARGFGVTTLFTMLNLTYWASRPVAQTKQLGKVRQQSFASRYVILFLELVARQRNYLRVFSEIVVRARRTVCYYY